MRAKYLIQFGLPGVLVLALGLTVGWTQQPGPGGYGPGGGFPGGGGGGRGRGNFDPGKMFDFMANGRASISIIELARGRDPGPLQQWAAQNGVTNGELTRDQFAKYMEARMAERMANGGGPGGGRGFGGPRGGPGGAPPGAPPGAAPSAPPGAAPTPDGGVAPPAGGPEGAAPNAPAEEEEKRPLVHRPGKLPKGLPDWFARLDTDGDGQIGLYEWRDSGRSLDEFRKLDRNGDGFITIEEALHSVKVASAAGGTGVMTPRSGEDSGEESSSNRAATRGAPADANANPNATQNDGNRQWRRQGNGGGRGGFGKGGFGKNGGGNGGRRDRPSNGDGQGEQRRPNSGN
jgi:hypothetical protein